MCFEETTNSSGHGRVCSSGCRYFDAGRRGPPGLGRPKTHRRRNARKRQLTRLLLASREQPAAAAAGRNVEVATQTEMQAAPALSSRATQCTRNEKGDMTVTDFIQLLRTRRQHVSVTEYAIKGAFLSEAKMMLEVSRLKRGPVRQSQLMPKARLCLMDALEARRVVQLPHVVEQTRVPLSAVLNAIVDAFSCQSKSKMSCKHVSVKNVQARLSVQCRNMMIQDLLFATELLAKKGHVRWKGEVIELL